jgi:transposase
MTEKERSSSGGRPKYIELNRQQLAWLATDVEELIPPDHPARAIWQMISQLDLGSWEREIQTREGEAGRPCWEPRLLASIWVYGYSQGIESARDLERKMEYERGLQWLSATQVINAHTLSDFRMSHKGKLNGLMRQVLALLEQEGMIDLDTVTQDGTKVQAVASKQSLHRRRTLEQRLEKARQVVEELNQRGESDPGGDQRKEAARRRGAADRMQRLEQALKELGHREAQATEAERDEIRVSDSEPTARKMKHSDGGWAPSYNLQMSTETKNRIIVGIRVSQQANDMQELKPALAMIGHLCQRKPRRVLADNGYVSRENVEQMAELKTELIAPWKTEDSRQAGLLAKHGRDKAFGPAKFVAEPGSEARICPQGKRLSPVKQYKHHGQLKVLYEAQAADCRGCESQSRCCGAESAGPRRVSHVLETPAMQAYLERMQQPETQTLYKRRKEVGEFPQLWMKGIWGWRRFLVRGLVRVGREVVWRALTYNIQQWIRIGWNPRFA